MAKDESYGSGQSTSISSFLSPTFADHLDTLRHAYRLLLGVLGKTPSSLLVEEPMIPPFTSGQVPPEPGSTLFKPNLKLPLLSGHITPKKSYRLMDIPIKVGHYGVIQHWRRFTKSWERMIVDCWLVESVRMDV